METDIRKHSGSKYIRRIVSCDKEPYDTINVDVYSVLEAFAVTNPGVQHAMKKLLCAGIRGKASPLQDLKEARDALTRGIQIEESKQDMPGLPKMTPISEETLQALDKMAANTEAELQNRRGLISPNPQTQGNSEGV